MRPRAAGARRVLAAAMLTMALAVAPAVAAQAASPAPVQCPSPSPSAPAASPAPSGGMGITALVCGPSSSAGTGPSSGGGITGGSGSSGAGGFGTSSGGGLGTGGTGGSSVQSSTPTPATLIDAVDLGGILSISGLSTGSAPTINPFDGRVQMWFTVRNTSKSSIDLTADFWMENALGMRLANVDGVALSGLKPGETRTLSAELAGAGQWTVLTTHVRVTPPAQVDGTELTPLTRDATVFVVPWLILLLAGAGAAAVVVVMIVRRATLAAVPQAVSA